VFASHTFVQIVHDSSLYAKILKKGTLHVHQTILHKFLLHPMVALTSQRLKASLMNIAREQKSIA
jgi:hypothetical protein